MGLRPLPVQPQSPWRPNDGWRGPTAKLPWKPEMNLHLEIATGLGLHSLPISKECLRQRQRKPQNTEQALQK